MSQPRTPKNLDVLERARYFPRQIVSPSDLSQDQDFLLDKLRRHNRLLQGWGFVSGLKIERISKAEAESLGDQGVLSRSVESRDYVDYWVRVTPGYALSPVGDEVYLPCAMYLNTREETVGALVSQPGECPATISPRTTPTRNDQTNYYLTVEPYEAQAHPAPTASDRCGDHADKFEYSRVRDTLRFCLKETADPPPYNNQDGPPFGPERLTGRHPSGCRIRNHLILGAIRFQQNKVSEIVAQNNHRDRPLGPGSASTPSSGVPTLPPALTSEQRAILDLAPPALFLSEQAYVDAIQETCRRKNVAVIADSTLRHLWETRPRS